MHNYTSKNRLSRHQFIKSAWYNAYVVQNIPNYCLKLYLTIEIDSWVTTEILLYTLTCLKKM